MDYDKLAQKFGGSESKGDVDYDSVASKLGGAPAQEEYTPPEPPFLAQVGRGMLDVGQGIKQLGLQAADYVNPRDDGTSRANEYRGQVQDEMAMYEKGQGDRFDAGRLVGNLAGTLPTALIPGMAAPSLLTRTIAGAAGGGLSSGAMFTPEGQSRLSNTLMGASLGAIIPAAMQKGSDAAKNAISNKSKEKIANFVKSRTLGDAQAIGLKVPPSSVNPSATNQMLEGISGKIKTEQAASAANKQIINRISKEYLGIADDIPLSTEVLAQKRLEYGKAYDAVRSGGRVSADDKFRETLASIGKANSNAAKDFPELASPDIDNLLKGVNKEAFDADSAVDVIHLLRDRADKAYIAGDKSLGKANKAAATALEDLLERDLTKRGFDKELVSQFKNSRQEIAKTYSIQKALNAETGDVDASKLAKELAKGKPLTGNLKTVAEFATAFPKATQNLKGSTPAISPLDYTAGMIGLASSGGNPLAAAAVAARPGIRKLILSDFYQNKFAKLQNDPTAMQRIAPILLDADAVKKLTPQSLATLFANTGSGANSE